MTRTTFDTLKATDMLTSAGIAEEHARAITATMREAVTEGVATKTDIAEVKADIAGLETRVLKVAIGVVVANTALTTGLTVGLLRLLGVMARRMWRQARGFERGEEML